MSAREVVYEVSLHVRREIAADYLAWLRAHIGQMLALPGFLDATLYAIDADRVGDEACGRWCVQYRLRDRAALDAYLRDHASRMREDAVARFGSRFRAERRILRALAGE